MERNQFLNEIVRLQNKYGCKLNIEIEETFKIENGNVVTESISVNEAYADVNEYIKIMYNDPYDTYAGLIYVLDKNISLRERNIFNKDIYEIIAAFMIKNDTKVFDQIMGRYNVLVEWDSLFDEYKDGCADISDDWREVDTNFDHDALVAAISKMKSEREEADKIRFETEYQLRKTA